MTTNSSRRSREARTVTAMISLYCHDNHHAEGLCTDCRELADYALERLEKCPFGEKKPTCTKCPVHCYKPDMREKIRNVMRYAGPRMIFKHPIMALRHLIDERGKAPSEKPASK